MPLFADAYTNMRLRADMLRAPRQSARCRYHALRYAFQHVDAAALPPLPRLPRLLLRC